MLVAIPLPEFISVSTNPGSQRNADPQHYEICLKPYCYTTLHNIFWPDISFLVFAVNNNNIFLSRPGWCRSSPPCRPATVAGERGGGPPAAAAPPPLRPGRPRRRPQG